MMWRVVLVLSWTLTVTTALLIEREDREALADGAVRLVGGRTKREGNVLIWHALEWGSVCDDGWTVAEALVVCKELGFHAAERSTEYSNFGKARKTIWMDNVRCYGDESGLSECGQNGWGVNDCSRDEAAGVVCAVPEPSTTPRPAFSNRRTGVIHGAAHTGHVPAPARGVHDLTYKVRLRGGRNPSEGRVEVQMEDEGEWGVICSHGNWGLLEGAVVCRQLGLHYAKTTPKGGFGGHERNKVLAGVRCQGTEASLSECFHEAAGADVVCPQNLLVAGLICTTVLPDLQPNVTILVQSMHLQDIPLYYLTCSMEENCVASQAYEIKKNQPNWHARTRRLLRFSSTVHNIGTADFRPNLPKQEWEWHLCHMHFHSMSIFAHYDILDFHGNRVAEGHKASFCLEDVECLHGVEKRYTCDDFGEQGISVGCADKYHHDIDCQWIDITELQPGTYIFKMNINPDYLVAELDFSNNAVTCGFRYTGFSVQLRNCTIGYG